MLIEGAMSLIGGRAHIKIRWSAWIISGVVPICDISFRVSFQRSGWELKIHSNICGMFSRFALYYVFFYGHSLVICIIISSEYVGRSVAA